MLFETETTKPQLSSSCSLNSGFCQQDRQTIRSQLLVAATGLGKTVMMGQMAARWPTGRVMLLSHRFELNQQAIASLSAICGEEVTLEQASFVADRHGQESRVVVASVQTLNSKRRGRYRMENFDPNDFGLLMIDEAHRSAAVSYQRVINHFMSNPECRLLGVTATPDRSDKVGLGKIYDRVAGNLTIDWGIENGWLVDPKQKLVYVDSLDMSQIRTKGGDLDDRQLAKLVEAEDNLHAMAAPVVKETPAGGQAIVFAASVGQSRRLAQLIQDYHVRYHGTAEGGLALHIDGSLSPQDPARREMVAKFKSGEARYLCNCGVATEGFDAPNAQLIAVGRPTKARSLYTQMVGRGTRPLPGTVEGLENASERRSAIAASDKPHCTVLDFIGQSGRHKLVCTTDILAGEDPPEVVERAKKEQRRGDFNGTTLEALQAARAAIEAEREAARARVTAGVSYRVADATSAEARSEWIKSKCGQGDRPSEKQLKFALRLGAKTSELEVMKRREVTKFIDGLISKPRNGFASWVNRQNQKLAKNNKR